jgi:hypothetical protein
MREATRPKRCSLADAYQVEGPLFVLSRSLPVRSLRRVGQEEPFGPGVDQDVFPAVAPLEIGSVPFIYLAPSPDDIPRIETHRAVTLRGEAS